MKTHELAAALVILAKWLRNSPNDDIESLPQLKKQTKEADTIATALSSLAAFSTFTKQQWIELIITYEIPIEVKSTYSSRDVMGKMMNYFAENSEARHKLLNKIENQNDRTSPELMHALSVLLRN